MRAARALVLACALAGCGRFGFGAGDNQDGGDGGNVGDGSSADATDAATPCVPTTAQLLTSTAFVVGFGPSMGFASFGDGVIGAWNDLRDGAGDLYVQRFDAAGLPVGQRQRLTSNTTAVSTPRVIRIPTGYALTWAQGNMISIVILDAAGMPGPIQPVRDMDLPLIVNSAAYSFDVGAAISVVSDDNHDGTQRIYLSRLDYTGAKIGSDVALPIVGFAQMLAAASNGNAIAVAYYDSANVAKLARFSPTGASLGTAQTITSTISGSTNLGLAWGDDHFGATWSDGVDVKVSMFDVNGALASGPTGIHVASNVDTPDIAWLGSNFGVLWRDGDAAATRLQRVSVDITLVGTTDSRPTSSGNAFPLLIPLGNGAIAGWSPVNQALSFQRVCP